ncbi:MAG TPA: hypothetical protein VFE15_15535 [Marmoricola sp.]|jgi:hypothetical protein|nr:hypothetical protein [Marmoricola sp.]
MPQTTLFDETDLIKWLHRPVTPDEAGIAEEVVWGWLRPLIKLADRPEEPSPELRSWAIELGGIAHVNPECLARYELENELSFYSAERRNEILDMAATGGTIAPGAPAVPLGSFPPAQRYPDPARPGRLGPDVVIW